MSLSPEQWMLVVAAVVLGILIGIAVTLGWRWYLRRRERLRRKRRIEAVSIDRLRDVAVPDGSGGMLHIDYVLLTAQGVLLLDVRDVVGNVFGSDAMVEWTVMHAGRRNGFANPQGPLYDRIAAIKAIVGDVPVEARVMFGSTSSFPKGLPRMTLREDALENEFPLGDRAQAEQLIEVWKLDWQRLRETLVPSEFSARS
ncbi:MAG: nuclease-related domain-containing protein [Gammaproteobacteria bacterium]